MSIKPLLFGFILLCSASNSCSVMSAPTDGIYLIPKGYTGGVVILFNRPDGVIPEVENGLYVYKIPEDGILKVKTKGVTGIVNAVYYYVDGNDVRQKITYLRVTGDRDPSGRPQNPFGSISRNDYENTVFVMNTGGLGSFNTEGGVVQYTSFIVGTPKDSERLYDEKQKRISNLARQFTREH